MYIQHNQRLDSNAHSSLQIRTNKTHKFANLAVGLLQVCWKLPLLDGLLDLQHKNIKCMKNFSRRKANKWQNMIFNFAMQEKNALRLKAQEEKVAHKETARRGVG